MSKSVTVHPHTLEELAPKTILRPSKETFFPSLQDVRFKGWIRKKKLTSRASLVSLGNYLTFDDLNSCKVFWQSNTEVNVDTIISYTQNVLQLEAEQRKNKEDRKFLSHSKPLSQEAEQRKLSSLSVLEMFGVLERTNPVLLQGHLEIKPVGARSKTSIATSARSSQHAKMSVCLQKSMVKLHLQNTPNFFC